MGAGGGGGGGGSDTSVKNKVLPKEVGKCAHRTQKLRGFSDRISDQTEQ